MPATYMNVVVFGLGRGGTGKHGLDRCSDAGGS